MFPDWDYSASQAVLVGTGTYTHLPSVPAALNSLRRMEDLLTGDVCGWPRERIVTFRDRRKPEDLADDIVQRFQDVRDIAIFYYVGHGQIDRDDMLCLGLRDSRPELARRRTTSLPFEAVRHALAHSRARAKIVILDCCYAGLATSNALAADDVLDLTRGTGAYTLAAAGEFSRAWYETDPDPSKAQTYFTKYFADVVLEGIPGAGPELYLAEIFHAAAEKLARDSLPIPTSRAHDHATRFTFARNAAIGRRPAASEARQPAVTAPLTPRDASDRIAERYPRPEPHPRVAWAIRSVNRSLKHAVRAHDLARQLNRDFQKLRLSADVWDQPPTSLGDEIADKMVVGIRAKSAEFIRACIHNAEATYQRTEATVTLCVEYQRILETYQDEFPRRGLSAWYFRRTAIRLARKAESEAKQCGASVREIAQLYQEIRLRDLR